MRYTLVMTRPFLLCGRLRVLYMLGPMVMPYKLSRGLSLQALELPIATVSPTQSLTLDMS